MDTPPVDLKVTSVDELDDLADYDPEYELGEDEDDEVAQDTTDIPEFEIVEPKSVGFFAKALAEVLAYGETPEEITVSEDDLDKNEVRYINILQVRYAGVVRCEQGGWFVVFEVNDEEGTAFAVGRLATREDADHCLDRIIGP